MLNYISNTSCLIILEKIQMLDILEKLYKSITITRIVKEEYGKDLLDFIKVKDIQNKNYHSILRTLVDPGEASTIALCIENPGATMFLDDDKARKLATVLNLKYTGTIGIILKAKQSGLITSVKEVLLTIENTNFRLSKALKELTLGLANENTE